MTLLTSRVERAAKVLWFACGTAWSSSAAHAQSTPRAPALVVEVRGERALAPRAAPSEPTLASTVVRGEALRQPGATPMDVLERVPGVQITRSGARSDLATASVRGATSAQTPVYIAGIAINDDVLGTADLSTVPLWLMDRVEVFRGNAPANVDRLGIGGAVLFEPRIPSRHEVGLGGALGSYGYHGAWALGGVRGGGSAALVGLRREGAANDYPFVNDQGTRFDARDDVRQRRVNADYRAHDVWAIARHELGPGARVLTLLNAYDREQGVTGLSVIPALHARARSQRLLGAVSALMPCGGSSSCQIELTTSALAAHGQLFDPERELTSETTLTNSDARRVVQTARLTQRFGDSHIGATAQHALDFLAIDRLENSQLRARRSVMRGALTGALGLTERVRLHALGSLDCHSTRAAGEGDTCGVFEPSGRAGASVALRSWLTVLGNVGRYVRVPTLGELFGISALVRGNSDVVPETGVTADLGLRLVRRPEPRSTLSAYFDGFAFLREVDDLIAYRRSSANVIRPYNVGRARLYGAELEAGASAFGAVDVLASATLMEPLDVTPGRQLVNDVLPFRSRLVTTAQTEVYWDNRDETSLLNRLSALARVHRRASRFADPAGLIVIAGHTSTDFEVGARLCDRTMAVRIALLNAFDQRSFDLVGLPLPGRSLYSSLEFSLGRAL